MRQILENEFLLKIMKNVFYFNLKAIYILKVFKFLYLIFGRVEKQLTLISKFMKSNSMKQTIAIHIMPNISRSKGMKDNEILLINRI